MIQEQKWHDETRLIIVDEEGHGTVQVSIPTSGIVRGRICAEAYIFCLWVDVPFRNQGVGRHLIEAAIKELKGRGLRSVSLEYDSRDSLPRVLKWYKKTLGFTPVRTDDTLTLLVKQI